MKVMVYLHSTLNLGSDEEEKWLLSQIIELWLTIRGDSIAGAWLEYHKQYSNTKTMKSVGLRKGLKCKRLDIEQTDETMDNVCIMHKSYYTGILFCCTIVYFL